MYFDTRVYQAPYCFSGFFKKVGLQAHFNTMCFSFAGKTMAADANQLQLCRGLGRADVFSGGKKRRGR